MTHVTISIVHYCQPDLLRRCLKQIEKFKRDDWEVFVVENSPQLEGAQIVRREFAWIKVLGDGTNLGYGGGHNLAFAQSNAEYFCVLNPDILILENSIEALVQFLEQNPSVAVIGPCLLNPDGSLQYSARRFYDWTTVLGRRNFFFDKKKIEDWHLMKDVDLTQPQKVDWVIGAAIMVRRSAFADGTLFDPRYKLYFEDVDLCYFAQKTGWDVYYCPDSKMIHDHQRSSAKAFNNLLITHFCSWLKFWWKTKRYRCNIKQTELPAKIFFVGSAGGHLSELCFLFTLRFSKQKKEIYISTSDVVRDKLEKRGAFYKVVETNRLQFFQTIRVCWKCFHIIRVERPNYIFTTGAAVGFIRCFWGKLFGAKIIWVDSIANTKKLSLSGRLIRPFADLIISQWPQVAKKYPNVEYVGELV